MADTGMDWTYPAGLGDAGIFEIGRRLAVALGRGPDATRFTYDARDMLRATREIERASRGGRLLTGFQTAEKLRIEARRFTGALYVLPPEAASPSLAERLRGVVPDKLRAGTGLPVILARAVATPA